jgi:hypothetical protein
MDADLPPTDQEILAAIRDAGGIMDPRALINRLCTEHDFANVIEGIQRAIERGEITLDSEGMVVAMRALADAA